MKPRFILAALAAGLACRAALAQTPNQPAVLDDPRIDGATGRLLATWPKDRLFDHIHLRLELSFPDMGRAYLEGVETLTIAPVGRARGEITLDCDGPVIARALLNGAPCRVEQHDKKAVITFPRTLPQGAAADLTVEYALDFGKNKGEGLTYSRARPEASSLTARSPQVHAQGQAELNSRWFPCLDHPSEKLTTEVIVHVEDGYEVVSNGRLVSRENSDVPGRVRWHWSQEDPHTPYLVTLVVGKLARVDLKEPDGSMPRVPQPVFTPYGTENNVAVTFGGTPEMLRFFEERFGVRYPWAQYAQCIVRDFNAGGMENTGCTLLTVSTSAEMPAGAMDDLISHELAHQWFGDLVTCKSWDHLWLNEGWATYSEALWSEHKGSKEGPAKADAAYRRAVLGFARGQRSRNRGHAPDQPAMCSNRFSDPDRVFMRADDPYAKGAMVLHMLRRRVGDAAFFEGARVYLERFAYRTAETDDFRRVMEEVSGQSLERFFDQWCRRPGLPRLAVTQDWDEASSRLTVSVEQTQQIDALNPAYAITLPVLVKVAEGDSRWLYLEMDSRSASTSVTLPGKPVQVSVDPNVSLLAAVKIEKPLAMWLEEAEHGPTLAARWDAIEHLKAAHRDQAAALLARIAGDDSADPLLRDAASHAVAAHSH